MKLISIALFIGITLVQLAAAADKPNFIILFADDLGYGDLGCYGSHAISSFVVTQLTAAARDFDSKLQADKQNPIYLEPPKPPAR